MFRAIRRRAPSASLKIHDGTLQLFGLPGVSGTILRDELEKDFLQNRPDKLLIQLCDTRFKRVKAAPAKADTVPQIDAVARVHGGLTSEQTRHAIAVANKLEIPIQCVDMPIKGLSNAVATRLLLSPTSVLGFLEFVLRGRSNVGVKESEILPGQEAFSEEYMRLLQARMPKIYDLLYTRRQQHMSAQILAAQTAPGENLAVLCEGVHVNAMREHIATSLMTNNEDADGVEYGGVMVAPMPKSIPFAGWAFVWVYFLFPLYCTTKVWGMIFRKTKDNIGAAFAKPVSDAVQTQAATVN